MKKSLILAGLLLAGTSLMASESGIYVGVDIGNTDFDMTVNLNGSSSSDSDDGGSQTLKIGYYMDKNSRVYASYQNVNADGADIYTTAIGYDYLIGNEAYKPFVGAFVGYGSAEIDDTTIDISGMNYGMQAGLNYAINENFSVEGGFRYMKSSMEYSISGPGGTASLEIDTIQNWFVGANYKF